MSNEAYDQAIQMIAGGLGSIDRANARERQRQDALNQQEAQTRRQKAMLTTKYVKEYGLSPEEADALAEGETSGFMPVGGVEAQRRIQDLSEQQRQQQQRQAEMQRQMQQADLGYKQARTEELQKPFELSREGQKLAAQQQFKALQPKEYKQNQYQAAGFAKRALMAEEDLAKLPGDIGTGSISDTIQGISFYPEALKSDERKLFDQAQKNFVSAVLRKESGAAISPEEYEQEARKYFPQPGDDARVLAQKSRARKQAIENLKAEAGGAFGQTRSVGYADMAPQEQPVNNAFAQNLVTIPGVDQIPTNIPLQNRVIPSAVAGDQMGGLKREDIQAELKRRGLR